ncbi:24393_t:CDS:2 [Gigaspora rosea]|nr:24393_t:CDS:2 [Gigaspora rosea]
MGETTITQTPSLDELREFKLTRVLNEDSRTKSTTLLGTIRTSQTNKSNQAILLFEKLPFESSEHKILSAQIDQLTSSEKNDIYYWYKGIFHKDKKWPDFKATLIWPATETLISKYSLQQRYMVRETPQIYEMFVAPFIKSTPPSSIQWVYNILQKKSEAEKIIFEDVDEEKGFILLPDMKWDCKTLESLYLVAIVHKNGIKSMRDLNESHLPLLKSLRNNILEIVPQRFPGVGADELRLFVHYLPSYYHFHVHVTHLRYDTIAGGISIAKAYLLDDIIDNIETFAGDYYQRCTLTYVIGENDELFSKLSEIGARVSLEALIR